MTTKTYLRAFLGLVLILSAGIGAGLWWYSGPKRPDPVVAPAPEVSDPERVRLIALGDVGDDSPAQRQVRDAVGRVCKARGCDFLVLLGDNLYPSGMETPDDPRMDEIVGDVYAPLGLPVYMVLGNHDYGQLYDRRRAIWQARWANRTSGFHMPSTTWLTQAGPVGLWGLDTQELYWDDATAQRSWLDRTVQHSTSRWRIALGHHPYLSNGKHGNAGSYEGLPGVPYAAGTGLQRFFEGSVCGRFDLVLTGHDHNLQWHEACGTTWIVSGAGAKTTPLVDRGNESLFEAEHPGFVWIELRPDDATIAFYDETGSAAYEANKTRGGTVSQPGAPNVDR
ncbi:MAG: hypothetical protein EA397_11255 [Deltaproteobacteria bacterium]|nr:MAG: hypothetical protein EA397_11255 [Deltaproteobacteria bacterium]